MKEETCIQNDIRVALSNYGICIRLNTGLFYTKYGARIKIGIEGLPDLLFIGNGFMMLFEVKTQKGKLREEQINFIEEMKKLCHKVAVVRSVEEAVKEVLEWKEKNTY